jgi:uncharacterized FlaG/YvyC family protein
MSSKAGPVLDPDTHHIATASKEGQVYVLVIDKKSQDIILAIPAEIFEHMVEFYTTQVYGSDYEEETLH